MSIIEPKLIISPQYKVQLDSPLSMPNAAGFLWNRKMMIQMNCRGYAVSQFMQPEHNYYTHHLGRFFYVKDESTDELFSVPYEPVRSKPDKFKFKFTLTTSEISWVIEQSGLKVTLVLSLSKDDVVELWQLSVKNLSHIKRNISIYPYFSIGYMS